MNKSSELFIKFCNQMSDRRPGPIESVGPKVRRKSDESPPGQALSGPSPVRLLFQMPDRTRAIIAGLLGSLNFVMLKYIRRELTRIGDGNGKGGA